MAEPQHLRLRFRLTKARKRALAAIAMVSFVLQWTGWTGPKLLSEIATVSWLSFFGSQWFRTVLVLSGVLTFLAVVVIWFRATPATLSTAAVSISGAPATGVAEAANPLGEELSALLSQGEALLKGLPNPDPFGMQNGSYALVHGSPDQLVGFWEDDVSELLLHYGAWYRRFHSEPPALGIEAALLYTPVQARLQHRLRMLREIIKRVKQ